jgi:hypothetical protein
VGITVQLRHLQQHLGNPLGNDLHQCAPRSSRGCHQPLSGRDSTVRHKPSCTFTCGIQPSSASILLASIA